MAVNLAQRSAQILREYAGLIRNLDEQREARALIEAGLAARMVAPVFERIDDDPPRYRVTTAVGEIAEIGGSRSFVEGLALLHKMWKMPKREIHLPERTRQAVRGSIHRALNHLERLSPGVVLAFRDPDGTPFYHVVDDLQGRGSLCFFDPAAFPARFQRTQAARTGLR